MNNSSRRVSPYVSVYCRHIALCSCKGLIISVLHAAVRISGNRSVSTHSAAIKHLPFVRERAIAIAIVSHSVSQQPLRVKLPHRRWGIAMRDAVYEPRARSLMSSAHTHTHIYTVCLSILYYILYTAPAARRLFIIARASLRFCYLGARACLHTGSLFRCNYQQRAN